MADEIRAQAADALRRGESALQDGDLPLAAAWFERARRMVPADPALLLHLAGTRLRMGDRAAGLLYAEAARLADTREIWLGLAAARMLEGDIAGARAALARMLGGHVLPADLDRVAGLADRVCEGASGWCGVIRRAPDAELHWIASRPGAEALVDGRPCPADGALDGATLTVTHGGIALLGSPIVLDRLRRVEGLVEARGGGLAGWAWHPADADADPWITVQAGDGGRRLRVRASSTEVAAARPLTRPRGFLIPAAALAELAVVPGGDGSQPLLHVLDDSGQTLAGSPLDPSGPARAAMAAARLVAAAYPATGSGGPPSADFAVPADIAGPAARAEAAPLRPVAIVVPVYRGRAVTMACLRSVIATMPAGSRIIVVDDASPEPDLAADLDTLAASGQVTLIRHAANRGFPASANAGLRAAFALRPAHDGLLLNSDTLVPTGKGRSWLERLRDAVHSAPDIGTAAPLSNDATILSYPARDGDNPPPGPRALARLDALAQRANGTAVVEIPTSVGFCMYVRRECAEQTGLFRTHLFAQGYGEENDFCLRARHLGWRHVAVPGVFVAHCGSASFGAARAPLVGRNLGVIEGLHPGYRALIAAYQGDVPAHDALAPARRRIDALRWARGRRHAAVILVTHDSGGGVERVVRQRAAEIAAAGMRAIVLRPVFDPAGEGTFLPDLCRVADDAAADGTPNLVFRLPAEMTDLVRLLRADHPAALEIHHRLGHHGAVLELGRRLGVPVDHRVHDYAAFCPRITLLGPERRYCGEPDDVAVCEACVADAGARSGETIGVAALRARSAAEFSAARRVVVPSADMAHRLRRHFPDLRPEIVPLEDDAGVPPPPAPPETLPRRVCVIGAIGVDKGFDVLLACARDAAARKLPLDFVLVGHSHDDARLIDTGRVFITGRYAGAEACDLIRAQAAHLAFLPSIWPETWGFTLGLAWRAGLQAAVFDIGAMAARVRATGHGLLLPLGLPASSINQVFLLSRTGSLAAARQDRLSTEACSSP